MNHFDFLQIALVLGVVILLTAPLGKFMARVFQGEKTFLHPLLSPLERLSYSLTGADAKEEMNWQEYTIALLVFNLLGIIVVTLLLMFQGALPLNPQKFAGLSWDLAFNTAVSFVSNTNWQAYSGENMLSNFSQMIALSVQNFVSAATGFAVLLALVRGLTRKTTDMLGNFWIDMTRSVVYILLPLSILWAVVLGAQGVVQNFHAFPTAKTLEGVAQILPQGPAASQIAIKQIGTNGGGFFNANSAHPYENPTPLTNFLEMIALILIPAALTATFGLYARNKKEGWAIFTAMMILLVAGLAVSLYAEYAHNPLFPNLAPIMEGKETRFGTTNSVLWSVLTTAASNGSVNAMHSSLSPLTGLVAMFNIMLGEVVFGGVGSGLYGMLHLVILTVFLSGLMVGRTPEYLGKKIEAKEVQMTILGLLAPNAVILLGAGISVVLPIALSSLSAKGPHGLSEILYAFTSAGGNNGSAFAGLNANTKYFNLTLAFAMLVGRFLVIVPAMVVAGSMAKKKITPPSVGTFTTDNALFVTLLIGVTLIVAGLTFFPALALGPGIEHLLMLQGKSF